MIGLLDGAEQGLAFFATNCLYSRLDFISLKKQNYLFDCIDEFKLYSCGSSQL